MKNEQDKKKKVIQALLKNKYLILALLAAVALLLIPSGGKKTVEKVDGIEPPRFQLSEQEQRLERQLSKIVDVGAASVLLSVTNSVSRELAENADGPLVLSASGGENVVELYYVNPKYMGAVIVCQGADSAKVRLEITRAVEAFTGLKSDKISVIKMK